MTKRIIILLFISVIFNVSYSQEDVIDNYMLVISKIHYKEYEEAEILLTKLISENNRNDKLYMTLGKCYYEQEKYEQAVKEYVLAMKNKNKIASYKIAECYSKMNDENEAIEYLKIYLKTNNKLLQSQIKLNPAFSNIETSKAWINLWKEEHYNNYEKKLDEAKFLSSKGDFANAFDIIDKLIIQNPMRHKAHEIRGDMLVLKNEYVNAAKSYIKALSIKKHNKVYREKAMKSYFKSNNYKSSLKICKEAIKENPEDASLYLWKAKNEFSLKKYNKVETSIEEFLKYYPINDEALNLVGKVYYNKKKYLKALEKYNVLLSDESKIVPKAEYFINRADAYMAVSMFNNAEKDLSMALDLNPKLPEVYYKRGLARLKANNKFDACSDFKKAYNLGYYDAINYTMKYCR